MGWSNMSKSHQIKHVSNHLVIIKSSKLVRVIFYTRYSYCHLARLRLLLQTVRLLDFIHSKHAECTCSVEWSGDKEWMHEHGTSEQCIKQCEKKVVQPHTSVCCVFQILVYYSQMQLCTTKLSACSPTCICLATSSSPGPWAMPSTAFSSSNCKLPWWQ